jgi:integrase
MPTVGGLAEHWLERHVALKRKPATLAQYRRIVKNQINPHLGNTPVDQVVCADAERLHASLAAHPFAANRMIAVLSSMLTYAERRALRSPGSNPCRDLERYSERKRKRPLTRDEITRLWAYLSNPNNGETVFVVAALQLLLLTGMRKKEVLTLFWKDVELEPGVIHLRDAKTGPRDVILSQLAVDLLVALPRGEDNPFVICGDREGQHLVNLFKPWERIRRQLGFPEVRIHDLRHTVASMIARSASLVVVRDALGHQAIETTSGYSHAANDDVRSAVDGLARTITGAA